MRECQNLARLDRVFPPFKQRLGSALDRDAFGEGNMPLADIQREYVPELAAPEERCGPSRVTGQCSTCGRSVLAREHEVGDDVRVDDNDA